MAQPATGLVSIVIPCYNPTAYLLEALASAKAQTYRPIEIIVIDDGTDTPDGHELLQSVSRKIDRYIEQPNRGLAAARNAGFRAAGGSYVVPLDSDDLLHPTFVAECSATIGTHPDAAFIYTDYRVFGQKNYIERLGDYNLYHLLDRNSLVYASLIRKQDWEISGGYDDSMRFGYEDWEFWLRLGARGRFGHHLDKVLFSYRKHGPSLFDIARARHNELVAKIQSSHPDLYSRQARVRIKAKWEPAVCVIGAPPPTEQTIEDWEAAETTDSARALTTSRAPAFLFPENVALNPQSVELAALAVWGGKSSIRLPDGSVAVSRPALARSKNAVKMTARASFTHEASPRAPSRYLPGSFHTLHRHLVNAELVSVDAWLKHPLRSAVRLIPLHFKQWVNRRAGRSVFDLGFYLKFQPRSLVVSNTLLEPLRYMPKLGDKRHRVALVTRHLGAGGAEQVLLEIAGALDRSQHEILVIATHSADTSWLARWQERADHVYDLAPLVSQERLAAAVYSIAGNWQVDFFLVQNTLEAYGAIPPLKQGSPGTHVMDLIHAVDPEWDVISATAAVSNYIDLRIVISEAARSRLRLMGVEENRIRLIRNGVDLQQFNPALRHSGPGRILFAARLDPVKRPLVVADVALALLKRRGHPDLQFLVAGAGPEEQPLRRRLRHLGIDHLFAFLGHVPDMAAVLAESDVVIIPSKQEGIPLILLEALAAGKPVVASDVGAIGEVLDSACGFLIDAGADEAERFTEAIATLLDQPQLREKLGREGRRRMEAEYDIQNSRKRYRELFAPGFAAAFSRNQAAEP